jgi:cellulose synthase/poly-beta-1,6-N-acetylglucosamine synthase-like glycosyltransferase
MLLWVTVLFVLLYALLMAYYVYWWYRVPLFVPLANIEEMPFISVVVAARNEAENLPLLLRALAAQTWPASQFEIIIVDDYSTDETALVVQQFASDKIGLISPGIPENVSSKKKAIEAGVAAARGPLIAVTDADCQPQPQWLELLAACYCQNGSLFIVAPVRLTAGRGFGGVFQQLDFAMLQGITAAGVQAGAHSMCNGANLGYKKSAFNEVGGFTGVDKLASGDDMMLLYKIWQRHPQRVHYLKHKNAIMPTPAAATWRAFIQQRIRWSSKATYYQDKRISAVLFLVYFFNVWCLVLLVAALLQSNIWVYTLLCLGVKTGIELLLLAPITLFYGQARLLLYFPLLQPFHIVYTVLIGLLSLQKTYEWKGRRTR